MLTIEQYDLKYSRRDRLAYFLRDVLDREIAYKVYEQLDWLPDKAVIALDNAIYEDLQDDGYIPIP